LSVLFCHTDDDQISAEQEVELLKHFDLNADYGPCSGACTLWFLLFYIVVSRHIGSFYTCGWDRRLEGLRQ